MTLIIDPEFADKIPPLSDIEYRMLEENILAEGRVINPLIVWNGLIVDGHNRYRILQEHPELPYQIYEKNFSDRNEVIAWICRTQLGRRNLTPVQRKYLIGKQYLAEKARHGGDRKSDDAKSSYQNGNLIEAEKTCERIARENGIGRTTVIRDGAFASGLDAADEVLPGIRQKVLSGDIHPPDRDVSAVARASPDKREALARKLKEPGEGPQIMEPVLSCSEYEEDVEDDDFSGEDDFPAFEPKKTKAQELREIQAISESMLHASGGDTIEDVMYELNDALESMIFRWNFCFETHEAIYRKKDNLKRIRLLAKEGINYLKTIGGKQVHENQ